MDNKPILYGIVGLVLGVAITTFTASNAVNTNNTGMMRMMGMQPNGSMMGGPPAGEAGMGMESSMEEMMESMEGKTEDEFDRAFIDAMIVHHQGAIEMAEEALTSAGRDEIKVMANDIISTQTKEIEMMKQWQEEWR